MTAEDRRRAAEKTNAKKADVAKLDAEAIQVAADLMTKSLRRAAERAVATIEPDNEQLAYKAASDLIDRKLGKAATVVEGGAKPVQIIVR